MARWKVLAVAVVLQWALVAGLAVTVRHNGWTYYQGGDQLWYYTGAWLLTHGQFWNAGVGYFWTLPMVPLAAVFGPDIANAYPLIVSLQFLLLLPLVLVTMYAIGERIAGRLFGYWVVLLWLVVPLLGIKYTDAGYHQRFTEALLPQAFGLTGMADFPTMVVVAIAVYFCIRSITDGDGTDFHAIAAGLAAGAAIALKSSAALFLIGPALGFIVARRLRMGMLFFLGICPDLAALSFQKWRGFGDLPLFQGLGGEHLASGRRIEPLAGVNLHKYLPFHWGFFLEQLDQVREHFWSVRLIEWLVIAGAIALVLRSRRIGGLTVGWFVGIVILKTASARGDMEGGSLLRLLMPAYPAFILLLAALPFLLPGAVRRLPAVEPVSRRWSRKARVATVAMTIALTAVLPIGVYAATSPLHAPVKAAVLQQPPIPVRIDLNTTARRRGNAVTIAWRAQHPSGARVFYRVFRSRAGVDPYGCPPSTTTIPLVCQLELDVVGTTYAARFVDRHPAKGTRDYFVGVAANWVNDVTQGDVYELGKPAAVTFP